MTRRGDRFGLFIPLSRAYGKADAATRAQVLAAGASYDARLITEKTYIERMSAILQVTLSLLP